MAPSNKPTGTPSRGKTTVRPEFGMELLSRQIGEAREILETRPIKKVTYISWQNTTRNYVEKAFGENHRNVRSFGDVAFWSKTTWTLTEASEHYAHRLSDKIVALEGYVKELETEIKIQEIVSSAGTDVEETSRGDRTQIPKRRTLRRPPIFLSHSTEETEVVTKLIDTLINGLHLPEGTFFCSSVPGMGIPNGLRFIDYIRDTIDETRLVIFLVSPGFLESKFCLAESGAAWVKSVDQIILLTPSLRPKDLGGVFDGIQAANFGDKYALNELRAKICNALSLDPPVNNNHWERVRNDFLDYVAKLPPARLESAHPGVGTPEGIETPESAKLTTSSAPLSGEAQQLLSAASKDQSGIIAAIPAHGGRIISCGSQQFAQLGNAREQATWEAVLEELEQLGFIKSLNSKKNAYQMTRRGYEAAKLLSEK
jgi:hypothetical protein